VSRSKKDDEVSVSLDGLSLKDALGGLLAIPDPDATKPKHEKAKRKKTPPTDEG
jgi:hypothetical protein